MFSFSPRDIAARRFRGRQTANCQCSFIGSCYILCFASRPLTKAACSPTKTCTSDSAHHLKDRLGLNLACRLRCAMARIAKHFLLAFAFRRTSNGKQHSTIAIRHRVLPVDRLPAAVLFTSERVLVKMRISNSYIASEKKDYLTNYLCHS